MATPKAKEKSTWNEAEWINPYLSAVRQWICMQLAILVPNNQYVVYSHVASTKEMFKAWTGYTQTGLEDAWKGQGFTKSEDLKKSGGSVWVRNGGGPVTTSCEALINKMVRKLGDAGYARDARSVKSRFSSFNIGGLGENGREPASTPGWHWYRDRTADLQPQPGDMFQIGTPFKPGQWTFAHVGFITDWQAGDNPRWTTVEAGQGGPSAGYDAIKRNGPRPLNPVNARQPGKVLMGWLNIEEFLAGEPVPDQKIPT